MLRLLIGLELALGAAARELNVLGGALADCSSSGMALTGFTRSGQCVTHDGDSGSHHICIDLSSTSSSGENFCEVTGQSDWCSSSMACHTGGGTCPVEHWCVCQWAFASYIQNAGGCDAIQEIRCDAVNMRALSAYRAAAEGDAHIATALACLESRCDCTSPERRRLGGYPGGCNVQLQIEAGVEPGPSVDGGAGPSNIAVIAGAAGASALLATVLTAAVLLRSRSRPAGAEAPSKLLVDATPTVSVVRKDEPAAMAKPEVAAQVATEAL